MDVVDTQVHSNVLGTPEAVIAIMDAVGVSSVLIDEYLAVEPDGRLTPDYRLADGASRPIGPGAEAASLAYPDRFQFLMRVNPFDPGLEGWVEVLKASPNCRALRVIVFGAREAAAFEDGGFDPLFRLAVKHDLPVFVTAPKRVKHLTLYARAFPDLRIVIDHCGVDFAATRGTASIDDSVEMAEYENIAFKWAHAAAFLSTAPYPYPDMDPKLRRVVDAYGPERVMWSSDYTVSSHRQNWAEALFYLRQSPVLSDSDREWILGRTARKWLDWPAPAKPIKRPQLHPHNLGADPA